MKSITTATILATLLPTTLAAVLPRAESSCPFNYPIQINDTSFTNEAFYLNVKANNPAYDGHNVQIRNESGSQTIVIDKASPVLQAQIRDGIVYSEGRNEFNQISDLGPTAILTNTSCNVGNATVYSFDFSNSTAPVADGGVFNTKDGFYLEGLGDSGTYGLYHKAPLEVSNGFLICPVEDYYQLYYYAYMNFPGDLGDCESIGLQTTMAPSISNGNCTFPV